MKKERLWSDIVIYSLLTIAALYTLFPLLMALMNSFKSNRELLTNVMSWPTEWNLDNYIRTYEKMHYGRSFVNTVILAGLSVSLMILFSALAGKLPEAFTYAEYARRGFFELCQVSVWNLCILIMSDLFTSRKDKQFM